MKHHIRNVALYMSMLLLMVSLVPHSAQAITAEQRRIIDSGSLYFNLEETSFCFSGRNGVLPETSGNIPEPHRSILVSAAAAYSVSPNLLAALYLTEQGNTWKPLEGPYASSPVGASGPFQFMPATWRQHGVDGNGDGVVDIQNFHDAAFAAGDMASSQQVTLDTPLGNMATPFRPGTIIYFAMAYNWGSGNVRRQSQNAPLSAAPLETQNYVRNMHSLYASDFTRSGHPAYRDPSPEDASGDRTTLVIASEECGTTLSGLETQDPDEAREIILGSSAIVWGNAGSESSQRDDVLNCLDDTTLLAFATIVTHAGVQIPLNTLASDSLGGCGGGTKDHNLGRAIDIGYFGNGADGHEEEGDTLYRFLFNNRNTLSIKGLIWKYPPVGYGCMLRTIVGGCDEQYGSPGTAEDVLDAHANHIHVSFGGIAI